MLFKLYYNNNTEVGDFYNVIIFLFLINSDIIEKLKFCVFPSMIKKQLDVI
jgi:hypothetical protein